MGDTVDDHEFKVVLNGSSDLQTQLEEFKKACEEHERHIRHRCKRRYYNLGLMARIVCSTTDEELKRLLKNGTRTFLIDSVTLKVKEFDEVLERTKRVITEYQEEETCTRVVTGLAIEITGDCCRMGRMRNDCSVLLHRGEVITLTVDEAYKYSCFREISYVINLKYYLKTFNLRDNIKIGREVRGYVVKRLRDNIVVYIEEAGLVNSYEYIELPNQCYTMRKPSSLADFFKDDLQIAAESQADYIVIRKIRCKPFLKALRAHLIGDLDFKLIGSVDLSFVSTKMLDLMGIVKLIDVLWIPDMFSINAIVQKYVYDDVLPMAKCLKKPIIGSVPLERCSDFKRFENHEFLWKIDTISIEKSPWCNKYPLIVKKLQPIRDFRLGVTENTMTLKSILTSYQSIVNFVIRTISTIECQAIFMHCKCESAAAALGRVEIYCPVYILLPLMDDENHKRKIELARSLNLRRNLRTIVYTKEMNDCNFKPLEYGVEFIRNNGLIETGDFILTLDVGKEQGDDIMEGQGDDVVILRAFYLHPPKIAEKFQFA